VGRIRPCRWNCLQLSRGPFQRWGAEGGSKEPDGLSLHRFKGLYDELNIHSVDLDAKHFRDDSWRGGLDGELHVTRRGIREYILLYLSMSAKPVMQPNDLLKQSIPFSYIALSAAPNDGHSHTVEVRLCSCSH